MVWRELKSRKILAWGPKAAKEPNSLAVPLALQANSLLREYRIGSGQVPRQGGLSSHSIQFELPSSLAIDLERAV